MLAGVKQVGSDGAETIVGWAGNDILDGGTGSNKLYGGAGNDTLKVHLSSKDNLLSGGTGDDTLVGSYYAIPMCSTWVMVWTPSPIAGAMINCSWVCPPISSGFSAMAIISMS